MQFKVEYFTRTLQICSVDRDNRVDFMFSVVDVILYQEFVKLHCVPAVEKIAYNALTISEWDVCLLVMIVCLNGRRAKFFS